VSFDLFHGTTLSAAKQILDEGWRALDVSAVVHQVALSHDVDPAEVNQDLASYERFVTGPERGEYASFARDALKAEHHWAQRAPEVVWEALWSIWRIRNGVRAPEPWNTLVAGHAWVWEECKHERLAIVCYGTTFADLARRRAVECGLDPKSRRSVSKPLVSARDLEGAPEVAIPLPFKPPPNRLTIKEVERHVPWDVFALELGLSEAQFQHLANAGKFGPPASDALGPAAYRPGLSPPWWTSSSVERYLARSRSDSS
jgi:hypothetical protein